MSPGLSIIGILLVISGPLAEPKQQSSGVRVIIWCPDTYGNPYTYSPSPHFLQESLIQLDLNSSRACINLNAPLSQGRPLTEVFTWVAFCLCLIGVFGPAVGRVPQAPNWEPWPQFSGQPPPASTSRLRGYCIYFNVATLLTCTIWLSLLYFRYT